MGGMLEFRETGIYPDYLIFKSFTLGKRWKVKRADKEIQSGSLRVNRKVVCNYVFKDDRCKIQEVIGGVPSPEWDEIEVDRLMCD